MMQVVRQRKESTFTVGSHTESGTWAGERTHHRRWFCIMPGDMEVGGLVKVIPVLGLTIGMTLRVRDAEGCWKL